MGIANKKTRHDWIYGKHMKAFNFYKDEIFQEVDLIIDSPVSFAEAQKDKLSVRIADIVIPVISIDGLIKMKKKTGRDVDAFDIAELKRIKKLRKNNA